MVLRVFELHYRLFVMKAIGSFQANDPDTVAHFQRIKLHRLLKDVDLNYLRSRGTDD